MLSNVKTLFKTTRPVIIFPSSGTGAWEAALVNTLSPGDTVLMVETGQFALLWKNMAVKLGLVPSCPRPTGARGADAERHRGAAGGGRDARDQGRLRRA